MDRVKFYTPRQTKQSLNQTHQVSPRDAFKKQKKENESVMQYLYDSVVEEDSLFKFWINAFDSPKYKYLAMVSFDFKKAKTFFNM